MPVAPPPGAVGPIDVPPIDTPPIGGAPRIGGEPPIGVPQAGETARSRGWPALGLLLGLASAVTLFLFLASTRKARAGVPLRVDSRPHVDPGIQAVVFPPMFAPRFEVRVQPTIHAGEQHVILLSDTRTTI